MSILSLVAINKDAILLIRGAKNYCDSELNSLGGCPIEDASEHEWHPSI